MSTSSPGRAGRMVMVMRAGTSGGSVRAAATADACDATVRATSGIEGVVVGSTVKVNRRALVAVGMVMLAATAGFAGVAQADMEHGHPGDAAGILPPGDWTQEQVDFATDLVHRTDAALPDYMTRD